MYDYILIGVGLISSLTLLLNIAHRIWTHKKITRDIHILTLNVERHMFDSDRHKRMPCHWCGKYPPPDLK